METLITQMETLLTKKDVMRIFGVTERTVNRLMETGKLPYIKLGRAVRFDPKDVQALIERQKVTEESPA